MPHVFLPFEGLFPPRVRGSRVYLRVRQSSPRQIGTVLSSSGPHRLLFLVVRSFGPFGPFMLMFFPRHSQGQGPKLLVHCGNAATPTCWTFALPFCILSPSFSLLVSTRKSVEVLPLAQTFFYFPAFPCGSRSPRPSSRFPSFGLLHAGPSRSRLSFPPQRLRFC